MAVVPGSNRNLKLQFFSVELREYVRGILKTAWSTWLFWVEKKRYLGKNVSTVYQFTENKGNTKSPIKS